MHSQQLDETYRAVAERVDANTAVSIDADGRVHGAAIKAIEEPESLIELRKRVTAMMPWWQRALRWIRWRTATR